MRAAAPVLALAFALAGCDINPEAAPTPQWEARAAARDAPSTATAPSGEDTPVPERYRGAYAADALACERPGDPTQLDIARDAIAFHESSGKVLRVTAEPGAMTVTAALAGEGQAWEATYRFGLSADGRVLTDLDGGMARVRCD